MQGWVEKKLGDYIKITMGQSPKGNTCNNIGEGVPLLNGPTEFGTIHPSPIQFTVAPKRVAHENDLLFCVRGSTTGRMNWADQDYAIGRGLASFRSKDIETLSFLKGLIEFHLSFLLRKTTGSTFPNLSKDDLNNYKLSLPPLPEQKRIASILSALDDKIELNLQMNKTLEEMAMALYKHWFVDFGPFQEGEFVDSELGRIPKGWEVKGFLDIADLLSGGTPKTKTDEYWNGEIYWVSAKDIGSTNQFYIIDTQKKITEAGIKNSATKLLPKHTVIIVARGSVGNYCMIGKPMCMNQSCYGLYGKENFSQQWLYCTVVRLIAYFKRVSYGSVFDTITTSTFKKTQIICPPKEVLKSFDEKVIPLFNQLESNILENQTLTKTRDTLLPKLISGEVRV